jgi:small subunit ribosomal protein S3Ae
LKGRIFEAFLADLSKDNEIDRIDTTRKFRFRVEDVQKANCLTNFNGYAVTTDRARSIIKKWRTLIEGYTDVKTLDGFILRVFVIAVTNKLESSTHKTAYAQHQKVRSIRRKMVEIIRKEIADSDLKTVVSKLQSEVIGTSILKSCASIYRLQTAFVRKVKVIKAPKIEVSKFSEFYPENAEQAGTPGN